MCLSPSNAHHKEPKTCKAREAMHPTKHMACTNKNRQRMQSTPKRQLLSPSSNPPRTCPNLQQPQRPTKHTMSTPLYSHDDGSLASLTHMAPCVILVTSAYTSHTKIQHNTTRHNAAECNTMQHNVTQCNTMPWAAWAAFNCI